MLIFLYSLNHLLYSSYKIPLCLFLLSSLLGSCFSDYSDDHIPNTIYYRGHICSQCQDSNLTLSLFWIGVSISLSHMNWSVNYCLHMLIRDFARSNLIQSHPK